MGWMLQNAQSNACQFSFMVAITVAVHFPPNRWLISLAAGFSAKYCATSSTATPHTAFPLGPMVHPRLSSWLLVEPTHLFSPSLVSGPNPFD